VEQDEEELQTAWNFGKNVAFLVKSRRHSLPQQDKSVEADSLTDKNPLKKYSVSLLHPFLLFLKIILNGLYFNLHYVIHYA